MAAMAVLEEAQVTNFRLLVVPSEPAAATYYSSPTRRTTAYMLPGAISLGAKTSSPRFLGITWLRHSAANRPIHCRVWHDHARERGRQESDASPARRQQKSGLASGSARSPD